MVIVYKFKKSSNSYIRVYIADQVTIHCKNLSPLERGFYKNRPSFEAGFFKDVNEKLYSVKRMTSRTRDLLYHRYFMK
jgi:hypothetical protein